MAFSFAVEHVPEALNFLALSSLAPNTIICVESYEHREGDFPGLYMNTRLNKIRMPERFQNIPLEDLNAGTKYKFVFYAGQHCISGNCLVNDIIFMKITDKNPFGCVCTPDCECQTKASGHGPGKCTCHEKFEFEDYGFLVETINHLP